MRRIAMEHLFKKFRIISLLVIVLLMAASIVTGAGAQEPGNVDVITIKGTINPVLIDYVERGIQEAESKGSEALIIQMDTPGGLDNAMREIIQLIVNSRVPVVVYVAPSGGRAASAGLYILLSAHVAAMAPNTATGAATPISMGEGGEQQMSDELKAKVINDAIAYIRSLAESHGRNADWAERAVLEGISVTEQQALEFNVIDMVAPDIETLVAQLDGRQVKILGENFITLETSGAAVNYIPMKGIEGFLYAIADPNIAYILLSLAMLGIMVEIFNPGLIFPGVVGGISLLLAFYSLGVLPVNYAGILFIVLAFGLFVAEVLTTTFGLFTAGGIVSLVIGSLILFQGASPVFRVDPWLIATMTIVIAGAFAFIVHRAISAHRRQAKTGREELIGKTVAVKTTLNPEGTVFFKGERWAAISEEGKIKAGEDVVINRVDSLTLYVSRKTQEPVSETEE
jgi:membrane-bound serine protease (ClpP class)